MLLNMLKKDFLRQKSITIALFIFIMLAATLVSSGTKMIMELTSSIHYLFEQSKAPHFVQMHAGDIDHDAIKSWSDHHPLVQQHQIVTMLNIDGSNLYLDEESEKSSIMDIDFVVQNSQFDYLLNLDNEIIKINDGEIAVPIYFMQQKQLQLGDQVIVQMDKVKKKFTIVDFVRDAQMNPSIVHSKRFIVSPSDLQLLRETVGEVEYLIEYRLHNYDDLSEFSNEYQNSTMPKQGPEVNFGLFKLLNGLTDGVVAAVIILISIILNVIAILCIRFTMLATIEEDYREIGVMKAIGIMPKHIKKLYMTKYIVMAAFASLVGFILSYFINSLLITNIMLYMGTAPKSIFQHFISFISVVIIFFMVVFFCNLVLRRFNKISAVEALRSGSMGETKISKYGLVLNHNKFMPIPIFMGLQDVWQRMKLYRLLLFIFIVSSFIIIVPVNFLNTMKAPSFISYMGIGQSDIRIDLRHTDDVKQRYLQLINDIEKDNDVEKYSPLITSQFKVLNEEGTYSNLSIESGNFNIFPLDYIEGQAPKHSNEIALSYVNSGELQAKVGDTIKLLVNEKLRNMIVSGIYQDVTNGGKTAKALLPYNPNAVLWYVVSLDLREGIDVAQKKTEYEQTFYPSKITDLQGYLNQTLGNTVNQLELITKVAILIAVFISILITSLFLKMLIAKDSADIAILRSIGFALSQIRIKYLTLTLTVLFIGIVLGTLISNTIGQLLVSAIMTSFGASRIQFVINPWEAYFGYPLLLIAAVIITTLISIISMKQSSIAKSIVE